VEGSFDPSPADKSGWVSLSGLLVQSGEPAIFDMGGTVRFVDLQTPTGLDLGLKIKNLRPSPFLESWLGPGSEAQGVLSLGLTLSGSIREKISFKVESEGSNLKLQLPGLPTPLAPETLRVSGIWRNDGERYSVGDLTWKMNGFPGKGELSFSGDGDSRRLDVHLSTPELSLPELISFLTGGDSAVLAEMKECIKSGLIAVREMRLSWPTSENPEKGISPTIEGTLLIKALEIQGAGETILSQGGFTALLQRDLLRIKEGTASSAGGPVRFEGSVKSPFESPELDLEAAGILEAAWLKTWLPETLIRESVFYGPANISLELKGTPGKWRADLRSDLSGTKIGWKKNFQKPAGQPASLRLQGDIFHDRLELANGKLDLPFLELSARGTQSRIEDNDFRLAIEGAIPELSAAIADLPFLERIGARGGASFNYEMFGNENRISSQGGVLSLKEAGMSLPGGLADLNRIEGTVRFIDGGIHAEGVRACIGDSPVFLNADMEDLSSPRLLLEVQGERIRADELIFQSHQFLHQVEGRLSIDRTGILFDEVRVGLEKGTMAVVRGNMLNFADPQVTLEIDSARANIDEVIALWRRPEKGKKEPTAKSSSPVVVIEAKADEGVFWNMNFEAAEGRITYRNDILSIDPLRFETGEGLCTGKLVVHPGEEGAGQLEISGRIEGVNAALLHHDLLERRGIISGTLRGDFLLSGRIGREFLETSRGDFHLSVRQGVFRRLNFLSKVFSLLNISQVLTFQLPDMSLDGMPFQELKGTFSLRQGILSTEDLLVESNAMNLSLVGSANLKADTLDLILGVQPLGTVDKIVSRIPVAGWLLTGKERSLITALFRVSGPLGDPEVTPMPAASVSEKVLGVFQRVFHLPGHLIGTDGQEDPSSSGGGDKKFERPLPLH